MTAKRVPHAYLISNVTLGYGSPKYVYFLKALESRGYRTHTIEPFESIRPSYPIDGLKSERRIVGRSILDSWLGRKLQKSFKLNKYIFLPLRKLLLDVATLHAVCVSYRKQIVVVTTYDNPLFALFSRQTVIVQNFSEIWPKPVKGLARRRLQSYWDNVEICISPQVDRIAIAKSRYRNAEHFLVHNTPPLGKPSSQPSKYERIEVLYQGRLGRENYPLEFIALIENLAPHIHLHIAGIIEEQWIEQLKALEEKSHNVTLHGYLSAPALATLRHRCNVGIIAWDNNSDNTKYAAPNKLYEHLQNGDLIVMFPNHALRQLNEEFAFGKEVSTGLDMAAYLNQVTPEKLKAQGEHNYALHQSTLNFEHQIAPVISYLAEKLTD
ncbi:hypothetical protein [Neptunomonas marina]|uniref:Glycosyltransferase n=1 Tax=Neptunomonas marina TaxID=1815562 RepID=A0A437Q8C1_9GAMM|nr:hypothetical protein [Neptunomonas marina]RVU30748.1 hypothetical protein EOE65_10590 [Neptunomonas marina]